MSSVPRKAGRIARSVRTARYRYTEWPDGSRELYDYETDPNETASLADKPEQAALVEKLSKQLNAGWQAAKPKK